MKEKVTKRGRGRPTQYDRALVLERAMLLFWRRGYDSVSIADLSAELEMVPPSLYAAFGNKEQLYAEALDHYAATRLGYIGQAFEEGPNAKATVAAILRECAVRYADPSLPPGCMIGSAVLAQGSANTGVAQTLAQRRNESRSALEQLFSLAKSAGEIAEYVDIEALAGYFVAVVQGLSTQASDGADRRQLESIAETAIRTWETLTG